MVYYTVTVVTRKLINLTIGTSPLRFSSFQCHSLPIDTPSHVFSARLIDHSKALWASCFDDVASRLMGRNLTEMRSIQLQPERLKLLKCPFVALLQVFLSYASLDF